MARPARPHGVRVVTASAGLTLALAVVTALTWGHVADRTASLEARSLTDVVAIPVGTVQRAHKTSATLERVVVLGDSVGTGAGCTCTPFGPQLAQLLTRASNRPTRVSTLAQDGLDSAGLLTQLQSDEATIFALRRATAVTVTIGANDFDPSQASSGCGGSGTACYDGALQGLGRRLPIIVKSLRALTPPHTKILLMGYWNVFLDGDVGARKGPTYQRTSDELTRRVNDLIQAAAASGRTGYVDLYSTFKADGDDTALLADDGDHPSAAGHRRIARAMARLLAR